MLNKFAGWLKRQVSPLSEAERPRPRLTLAERKRRRRRQLPPLPGRHARCRHRSLTAQHRCRRCGQHVLLYEPHVAGFTAAREGRPALINPHHPRRQRRAWHSWLSGYARGRAVQVIKPVFEKESAA